MKRTTLYMIGGGSALALLLWPRGARALPGAPLRSGNVYWPYWPVARNAYLSSPFGSRPDPFGSGAIVPHTGIDLALPTGSPIFAAASGRVSKAQRANSCGNFVSIAHSSGWGSTYCHMDRYVVSVDDRVNAGDLIGIMDSTGASTGSHVHFMTTLNGVAKDPQSVVGRWPGPRSAHIAGAYGGIVFGDAYGASPTDLAVNQSYQVTNPDDPLAG